jgi:hypothetical protein
MILCRAGHKARALTSARGAEDGDWTFAGEARGEAVQSRPANAPAIREGLISRSSPRCTIEQPGGCGSHLK